MTDKKIKTVFDDLNIKLYKLPWWKKLLFFFIKTKRGIDYGTQNEKGYVTEWKIWRGKYYLVNEYTISLKSKEINPD